ncbi:MAG: hypothetical protein WD894_02875 [Pirellulales bacterium]
MNMKRRPNRLTNKEADATRRQVSDHADLLPWADPYIASLLRVHERQMRGQGNPRSGVR